MKNLEVKNILVCIIIILFISCEGIVEYAQSDISNQNVYVSGYYGFLDLDKVNEIFTYYPCYWYNGERVSLYNEGASSAITSAITTYNDDVYICGKYGSTYLSTFNGYPCYWINNVKYPLDVDSNKYVGDTYDILKLENDLYIVGFYKDSNYNEIACYWKNDTCIKLSIPEKAENSHATGIIEFNNDIYISGTYELNSKHHPCYWKNKNRVDLFSQDIDKGFAQGIYSKKGNIYVYGYYKKVSQGVKACYWKNEKRIDLWCPENSSNALASGIEIIGDDVYVSGNYNDYNCYWKNGKRIGLKTNNISSTNNSVNGVAIRGQNVCFAGVNSGLPFFWNTWKEGHFLLIPNNVDISRSSDIYVPNN